MGCISSGQVEDFEGIDREVLGNFLQNGQNLQTIWKQFHKNEDDVLDRSDFDHLLFCALQVFCKERDPNMPPPTRETLDPFVEKLRNELAPRIDRDGDGIISFEEFKSFGEYLKQEYRKLHSQSIAQHADPNISNGTTNIVTTSTISSAPIFNGISGGVAGATNEDRNMNRNDNIAPVEVEDANVTN